MSEKEYYLLTDSAWVPENIEIQGEYISNGKIVTGIGTSFTTDLQGGDWLVHPTLNEVSMIRTVETDTRLELYKPFSQDVSSFDPDYQAVLDYATSQGYTLPSAGQQAKENQIMLNLKVNGYWNSIETFRNSITDGDSNYALIDWKRLITMNAVNSPTFIPLQGYQGDGVSSYIDTLFNPSLHGVGISQNNISAGGYNFTAATSTYDNIIGEDSGSNDVLISPKFNTTPFMRLNHGAAGTGVFEPGNSPGFYYASRYAASGVMVISPNGVEQIVAQTSVTGLPNVTMKSLAWSTSVRSNATNAISFIAEDLSGSGTSLTGIKTIIDDYISSL